MDFASLMKTEIAKKSAVLENKKLITDNRKYFRREEMHKKGYDGRFVHTKLKHNDIKRKRDSGNIVIREGEDEIIPKKVNVADSDIAETILTADRNSKLENLEKLEEVPLEEFLVQKRLRERRQPIKLFGENEKETYVRLRKIELNSLGQNKFADGFLRNDFRFSKQRQKKEEIEALLRREYAKSGKDKSAQQLADDAALETKEFQYDIKLGTIEPEVQRMLPQKDEPELDAIERGLIEMQNMGRQIKEGARQIEQDIMLWIFRYWQMLWGQELNKKRSFTHKKSSKGRAQTEVWKQTEDFLTPLFNMLRMHTLPADIAIHLAEMVKFCVVERDYVQANNAYLRLSIGESPWPLGITMTQIHVRPGHEKIKAKNISHIFNDESQRRYIQGVKRLMTFSQRTWPTDPSKCVEFKGSLPEYDLLSAESNNHSGAQLLM